jgi:uncharacterized protein with von Willebrand factor type A (vWA) domain
MSLLTPELLRRLEQFQLLAARRAKSSAKGERRSRARGQSVEFADHRSYVPGDDFRYLDSSVASTNFSSSSTRRNANCPCAFFSMPASP